MSVATPPPGRRRPARACASTSSASRRSSTPSRPTRAPASRASGTSSPSSPPSSTPAPNPAVASPPIYISAVNKYTCRLVGELCDGIRMHPFNTPKYTREVIIPSIEEGVKKAGRQLSDLDIVGGGFLVTGKNEEEVEQAKAPA